MSVDVGSAVGYLDLDINGFLSGLRTAQNEAKSSTAQIASDLSSGLQTVGDSIAKVGTAMTAGITMPVVTAVAASVKEFAKFEQAVGGVETLFKGSADTVIKNSETAYKRAGVSGVEYMEQVTSFSARLLQGLGGDTEEAARIADIAMVDMSDNANKFGTGIESVQDAYQGFAKANYTMLDNLKLGYGGTKEEMARLLADAEKISGIEYDMENFDDIIEAIHVIQEEMEITGTTALEASTTISGSFGAAKAALRDFLAGFGSKDADMKQLTTNLVEAVKTAVGNIKEVLKTIWDNIPLEPWQKNVAAFVVAVGPALLVIGKVVSAVGGIVSVIGTVSGAIGVVATGAAAATPAIGALATAFTVLTGPVGLIIAGVAALTAGTIMLVKHLKKDSIPAIELFGDGVSEATEKAVGGFLELNDKATLSLKALSWSGQTVTEEMAGNIVGNFSQMSEQVLSKLDEQHTESLSKMQEFLANSEGLSKEEQETTLANMQEGYEQKKIAVEEGEARIKEIMDLASAEKRALTKSEQSEINEIQTEMVETGIKVLSDSEVESKLIMERMKDQAGEMSALQAAEVVKNSLEQKEGAVKAAEEQYDEVMREIIRQRDEAGIISEEQAQKLIDEAKRQKDEVINNAEEMHNDVITEAKAQASEHVNEVDWSTGEIKSKWEVLKQDVSDKVGQAGEKVKSTFEEMGQKASQKAEELKTNATAAFEGVKKGAEEKFAAVKTVVVEGMQGAYDTVTGWVDDFFTAGGNIVNSIARGIKGAIGKVTGAIGDVVEAARRYLPFSPAKEGPLKDLDKLNFGGTIAAGIKKGTKDVDRAMDDMGSRIIKKHINNMKEDLRSLIQLGSLVVNNNGTLGYVGYGGFNKTPTSEGKPKSGDPVPISSEGDTFNFYSPKPIGEIEAAKQMKQAKRDLAEGF